MIDQVKFPLTYAFEKALRDNGVDSRDPAISKIIHGFCDIEDAIRSTRAKLGVYEMLVRRVDEVCPRGVDRMSLSPIDLRKIATTVRAEVSAAQETIENIR